MIVSLNKRVILLITVCIMIVCAGCQEAPNNASQKYTIERNDVYIKNPFEDEEWFVYGMDLYINDIGNSYSKRDIPLALYDVLKNEEWYCLKKYKDYIVTVIGNDIYLYNTITDVMFVKTSEQDRIVTWDIGKQYLYYITETINGNGRKLKQYNIDEDTFSEVNLSGYPPYQFCLFHDELGVLIFSQEKKGILLLSDKSNIFWEDKEVDMCWNSIVAFCQEGIILKKEFSSSAKETEYYCINRQAQSVYLAKLGEAITSSNCCVVLDGKNELVIMDMNNGSLKGYNVAEDSLYDLTWQGKTENMNFVGYTIVGDAIMGMWSDEDEINLFEVTKM